jgi:hypothetical protein
MALGYHQPGAVVADRAQAMGTKWWPYVGASPARQARGGENGSRAAATLPLILTLSASLSLVQTEDGRKERVMPLSSSLPPAKSTVTTAS